MKFVWCSLFVLVLVSLASTTNVTWGTIPKNNILLYRQSVIRFPLKNDYWSVNFEYPPAGQTNKYIIQAVTVINNFKNTTTTSASLLSGGVGFKSVKLNIQSQYKRGINSTIEIRAKP